jgi:hypothetical protein
VTHELSANEVSTWTRRNPPYTIGCCTPLDALNVPMGWQSVREMAPGVPCRHNSMLKRSPAAAVRGLLGLHRARSFAHQQTCDMYMYIRFIVTSCNTQTVARDADAYVTSLSGPPTAVTSAVRAPRASPTRLTHCQVRVRTELDGFGSCCAGWAPNNLQPAAALRAVSRLVAVRI